MQGPEQAEGGPRQHLCRRLQDPRAVSPRPRPALLQLRRARRQSAEGFDSAHIDWCSTIHPSAHARGRSHGERRAREEHPGVVGGRVREHGLHLLRQRHTEPHHVRVPQRTPTHLLWWPAQEHLPGRPETVQCGGQQEDRPLRCELQTGEPLSLEAFLLDTESSYFEEQASHCRVCHSDADGQKWVALHEKAFQAAGFTRPTSDTLSDFATGMPSSAMRRWFLSLPLRVQEIAYYCSTMAPESGPEFSIDLSQSIDRASIKSNVGTVQVQCVAAKSTPWLARSRRFIPGREMLAMHGISLRSFTQHASDAMLQDLAGNSFSGSTLVVALASVLSARGA
mmetsp:Transcript_5036/g.12985  ORF Transcript_5036/g.12985 Transcript_5036/m.12985 type:complete len:338 (-) Transcript_5036:137-1150(-)